MNELCHGNAANRAMHELFKDSEDGVAPEYLKKKRDELEERKVLR